MLLFNFSFGRFPIDICPIHWLWHSGWLSYLNLLLWWNTSWVLCYCIHPVVYADKNVLSPLVWSCKKVQEGQIVIVKRIKSYLFLKCQLFNLFVMVIWTSRSCSMKVRVIDFGVSFLHWCHCWCQSHCNFQLISDDELSLSLVRVTVSVDVTIIDNVPFSFFIDVNYKGCYHWQCLHQFLCQCQWQGLRVPSVKHNIGSIVTHFATASSKTNPSFFLIDTV